MPDEGKAAQLAALAARIDAQPQWWRFPEERQVRGFLGTAPLFIAGDQPSTSPWPPSNPNRRAFYDLLCRLGIADAHLTDLYKKRGSSSSLKNKMPPPDLGEHLDVFREELAILKPTRVVALGDLAFDLLVTHVPEIRPQLRKMWHFGYAQRYGKIEAWEANAREAIFAQASVSPSPQRQQPSARSRSGKSDVRSSQGISPAASSVLAHVQYEFSRLCFKADVIEPLADDEGFCVITPVGTFAMTKRQFYDTFSNVVASESYRIKGIYHYPRVPVKALPFRVGSR